MKKIPVLSLSMLSIPFGALAHPGHDAGTGLAVTGGQLLGAAAVAAAALVVVASRRLRRRRAARADG